MQVPNMLEAKKRNNSKPINYEYKDELEIETK